MTLPRPTEEVCSSSDCAVTVMVSVAAPTCSDDVARHRFVDADGEGRHLGGRESRQFDGDLVGAGPNVDEGEVAAVTADARRGDAGVAAGQRDVGAGDHAAR